MRRLVTSFPLHSSLEVTQGLAERRGAAGLAEVGKLQATLRPHPAAAALLPQNHQGATDYAGLPQALQIPPRSCTFLSSPSTKYFLCTQPCAGVTATNQTYSLPHEAHTPSARPAAFHFPNVLSLCLGPPLHLTQQSWMLLLKAPSSQVPLAPTHQQPHLSNKDKNMSTCLVGCG